MGTEGTPFCQRRLSAPMPWRPAETGSGTSWKPLSDLPLGYILRKWKFLTLQKAWPQYKLGDQKNGL